MKTPEFERLGRARLEAANHVYRSLAFAPSDPEHDATYGRFEGAQPIALGRINQHADGAFEIGGFWVHERCRGRGLAGALVAHTILELPPDVPCWCIPFQHLEAFYLSFGMRRVQATEEVPASIQAKREFCHERTICGDYEATSLLVLEPNARA